MKKITLILMVFILRTLLFWVRVVLGKPGADGVLLDKEVQSDYN